MSHEEFIKRAKDLVMNYTNAHMDVTDKVAITEADVYVVWSCKT